MFSYLVVYRPDVTPVAIVAVLHGARDIAALLGKDELTLAQGALRPQREIRMYTNEEIAQALMDSAITPEGRVVAENAIQELGLNPEDFHPNL